jgi:hypothetical protein
VNVSSVIFDCSAPDLDSCPDESLPEFAFIGRSNVDKSSLLNTLAGELGMARVSATPGFTKLINIFTMNKSWRLVLGVIDESMTAINAASSGVRVPAESLSPQARVRENRKRRPDLNRPW